MADQKDELRKGASAPGVGPQADDVRTMHVGGIDVQYRPAIEAAMERMREAVRLLEKRSR